MKSRRMFFVATVLFVLFTMCSFATAVSAESGSCGENANWNYDAASGKLTISGTGAMTNYMWDHAPWYKYRESVKEIVIESGITTIGKGAFERVEQLTNITIPDTVTTIDAYAFTECRALKSINIPKNVTKISGDAFDRCGGLETLTVDDQNTVYYSKDNCIIEKQYKQLIRGCKNSVIPTDNSVFGIGNGAFSGCDSFVEFVIPDVIKSIGSDAFIMCKNLKKITIPSSVSYIGPRAFRYCESLEEITIPEGVKELSANTLSGCTKLKEARLPSTLEKISSEVFYGDTSLTKINIPAGVKTIEKYAFTACSSLKEVTFYGDAPQSFGENVFKDTHSDLVIYYDEEASGWSTPKWNGITTSPKKLDPYPAIPNDTQAPDASDTTVSGTQGSNASASSDKQASPDEKSNETNEGSGNAVIIAAASAGAVAIGAAAFFVVRSKKKI